MNITARTCLAAIYFIGAWAGSECDAQHPVRFRLQVLAVDANEGCAVVDVDNDGHKDVVAGRNWYQQPNWTARPLRLVEDWNGYTHTNGDFAYDVNGDGLQDIVAGGFVLPEVRWYENPGPENARRGFLWKSHLLANTGQTTNELSFLRDLDGDGRPEWISNQWNASAPLIVWTLQRSESGDEPYEIVPHKIGEHNGHGIGFGDLNNDGREDILVGTGWYERPATAPWSSPWTFHADWQRGFSCPMLVRDIDQDGKNDVVWGNPHDFGLYVWFADGIDGNGKLKFREHEIDKSYSQAHALEFADLDGDGQDELITGKRVRAHNGNDPGGNEPPLVCYYTWDSDAQKFTRHMIDRGHVGIGLQIRPIDIDGDGDIDLVMAGKDGTKILFNESR
ncbi:MAG: VCBS repeat-containing protein [Pirellulaceae bacterium]